MRKFYQKDWFGIEFRSFTKLNSTKIADNEFYDKFYNVLYKKYSSFEELPLSWKNSKKAVAGLILRQTSCDDKLLSIGCGNGYIEYLLKKGDRNIVAIEPSIKSTYFLKKFCDIKLYNGYFPECLKNKDVPDFDLIYMSGTEYIFNDIELIELLNRIKDFNPKQFLLISAACETNSSFLLIIKQFLKQLLSFARIEELGQLWGYVRTPDEFLRIFKTVGFKNIEKGLLKDNQFWIKGS